MSNKLYGKYRAIVTNVNDDEKGYEKMGRVKVKCPALWGESESNWCMICVPFASDNSGFWFMPNVGDLVWLEFEGGDPKYPIVSGGWFKSRKSPISDYQDGDYNGRPYKDQVKRRRIKTPKGHIIELNDIDGDERILIKTPKGQFIEIKDTNNKITISTTGSVLLAAPNGVTVSGSLNVYGNVNVRESVDENGSRYGGNVNVDKNISAGGTITP